MTKAKITSILIIVFIVGYFLGNFLNVFDIFQKQSTIETVKKLYELANPGFKAEVVNVEEVSGLYKIVLKLSSGTSTNYVETYVTKDGKLLTQQLIYAQESVKRMEQLKNFVYCLRDKGVRIYGILNQTYSPQGAYATLLQLNLLGRYSPILFVSCDGPNLQACLNAGIKQVPAIVYQGKVYYGVKSVQWLGNLTGCSY